MATVKKTTTSKITTVSPKAATQKLAAPVAAPVKTASAPAPVLTATQPLKTVAAPAPVAAAKPAPVAAKPAAPTTKTISKSEWQAMVEQAAYYVAEKNGFSGDPEAHWAEAEAQITSNLKVRGIKVA